MLARLAIVFSLACNPETSDGDGTDDGLGSITLTVSEGDAPLPGVPCAFDGPDGVRREGTTDDAGVVRFEGVDWSLGTAAAVCASDLGAFAYAGFVGEGDFALAWPFGGGATGPAPDTVSVNGAVTSPQSAGNFFVVQTTAGPGLYQDFGTDYALDVYADTPFDLLVAEVELGYNPAPHGMSQQVLSWAVAPSDALAADTVLDVDLVADAATPVEVAGTLARPASDALETPDVFGTFYVTPSDPSLYFQVLVGFATQSSFTADGKLAFEGEAIHDVYADDEVVTVYFLGGVTAASYLVVPGYPTGGDLDQTLLDVPILLDLPEYPSLETPLAWDPAGAQPLQAAFSDSAGNTYVVQWPAGATGVTVPPLPSGVELFSGSRVQAQFLAGDGRIGGLYERLSAIAVTFYL